MDQVVKTSKIYLKMLNNPSLLKDILSLLYKYANIFAIGFEKTVLIIAHNRPTALLPIFAGYQLSPPKNKTFIFQ